MQKLFNINIREEINLENINCRFIIKEDLILADKKNDIILIDLKLKKEILTIKFYNTYITSLIICKKPIFIDNKDSSLLNNSIFILSSSNDKIFALHEIFYDNNSYKFKLIALHQPTKRQINDAIQIDNGQFLISTRDQTLLLFNNRINNGTFQKLFKIKKDWPTEPLSLFEIKNNFVGVCWVYDDVEADNSFSEDEFYNNHKNDALIIYSMNGNEIKEIKILKKIIVFGNKNFFILLKNNFILKYSNNRTNIIGIFDLNNFQIICKLKLETSLFYIYPFKNNYFFLVKYNKVNLNIEIYNFITLQYIQSFKLNIPFNYNLIKINSQEYAINKFILKLE